MKSWFPPVLATLSMAHSMLLVDAFIPTALSQMCMASGHYTRVGI